MAIFEEVPDAVDVEAAAEGMDSGSRSRSREVTNATPRFKNLHDALCRGYFLLILTFIVNNKVMLLRYTNRFGSSETKSQKCSRLIDVAVER